MRRSVFILVLLLASVSAQAQFGIPTLQTTRMTMDSLRAGGLHMYRLSYDDVELARFDNIAAVDPLLFGDYMNISYAWKLDKDFTVRTTARGSFRTSGVGADLELDYRIWSRSMNGYYIGPSISYSYNAKPQSYLLDRALSHEQSIDFGIWLGNQYIWGNRLTANIGAGINGLFSANPFIIGPSVAPIAGSFDYSARAELGYAW